MEHNLTIVSLCVKPKLKVNFVRQQEKLWQVTCYQGLKWLMCLFCLQHQLLFSKSALRLTPPLSERRHGQIHHTGVDKPWLVHTRDPVYLSYDISADDRLGKKWMMNFWMQINKLMMLREKSLLKGIDVNLIEKIFVLLHVLRKSCLFLVCVCVCIQKFMNFCIILLFWRFWK